MFDLLKKKSIAVFGLGLTGNSSIRFFADQGIKVFAWDDNISKIEESKDKFNGYHNVYFESPDRYQWHAIDFLILSPGINLLTNPHKVVQLARNNACPMTSDICVFLHLVSSFATVIAVSGTNGKSTTTTLITEILKADGKSAICGGNIGIPVFDLPLGATHYVLEISSFQLDLFHIFPKFSIAVLLDITTDHLDRYNDFRHYALSKINIFKNQIGTCLISIDTDINAELFSDSQDKILVPISAKNKIPYGFSCTQGSICKDGIFQAKISTDKILPENIIASYSACFSLGISKEKIVETINNFKGLEHRIELVSKIKNKMFINDSKATNAVSANKALSLYKNIFWIAGGRGKKSDKVSEIDVSNVKKAYFIGEEKNNFYNIFCSKCKSQISDNLEDAFYQILEDTKELNEEITILLSPACASFDQWKNFEERGNFFKSLVHKIPSSNI